MSACKIVGWQPESDRSKIGSPRFYDPTLMRWLLHDDVLDVVESLIGPDVACLPVTSSASRQVMAKVVPWHEDSAYWGGMFDPMEVVTIWLAVDPATRGTETCR